jgi:hypoxanthine-guanine phosphoribosyltransferase
MLTTTDVAKVYDTILSIPGMNETVKIDLKITRRNVLLLNQVIERGLTLKGDEKSSNLLHIMPDDTLKELTSLADDCLKKAGLTQLSEKLKSFNNGDGK